MFVLWCQGCSPPRILVPETFFAFAVGIRYVFAASGCLTVSDVRDVVPDYWSHFGQVLLRFGLGAVLGVASDNVFQVFM